MSPVVKGRFDVIYGKAFERFVLDLARGYAAEEERVHREVRGKELEIAVGEIQLRGEYPKTRLVIRTYDKRLGSGHEKSYPIWTNREFFDQNMKPLCSVERMVSDTLMWARGG